jgi:hypothetical protein
MVIQIMTNKFNRITEKEIADIITHFNKTFKDKYTIDKVTALSNLFADLVITTSQQVNIHPKIVLNDYSLDFFIIVHQIINYQINQISKLAIATPEGSA